MSLAKMQGTKSTYKNKLNFNTPVINDLKLKLKNNSIYNGIKKYKIHKNKFNPTSLLKPPKHH